MDWEHDNFSPKKVYNKTVHCRFHIILPDLAEDNICLYPWLPYSCGGVLSDDVNSFMDRMKIII